MLIISDIWDYKGRYLIIKSYIDNWDAQVNELLETKFISTNHLVSNISRN